LVMVLFFIQHRDELKTLRAGRARAVH